MHPHQAYRAQQHFRRLDMQLLRKLVDESPEEVSNVSRVKEARRELEELFNEEIRQEHHQPDIWDESLTEDIPQISKEKDLLINRRTDPMSATRKRFIAGAVCPHCQAQDTLKMWREDKVDIVECAQCGHQQRQTEGEVNSLVRENEQVIGIFTPQ